MTRRPHPDASLTVRSAFQRHYDQADCGGGTLAKIGYHLTTWEKFSGDPPIGAITNETAATFRQSLILAEYAPRSINSVWGTVRMILRRMGPRETGNPRGLGVLAVLPWMKPVPEVRSRPRRIALGDLSAFYDACVHAKYPRRTCGVPIPLWWRTLFVLAYFTGLRKSDLLFLRRSQFDLHEGTLTFRAGKTQKEDTFPLHPLALKHVAAIWQPDRVLLLPGMQYRGGVFYRFLRSIQDRAGLSQRFGLHDVRRTAASEIDRVERGLGRIFLQHTPNSVTDVSYLNAMEELAEAIPKMRVPEAFAGIPAAKRIDKPKPAAAVVSPAIRRDDWDFPPGRVVYQGQRHKLTGRRWRALKALVQAGAPLSGRQLAEALDDERAALRRSMNAQGKRKHRPSLNVCVAMWALRKVVREIVGLPDNVDPIPCVDRTKGGAWQLVIPVEMEAVA